MTKFIGLRAKIYSCLINDSRVDKGKRHKKLPHEKKT